jgi:hypothetical protein
MGSGYIADLGDDAFQPDLAGVSEHLFAVDLEAFAEWMAVFSINFLRCALRSKSGSCASDDRGASPSGFIIGILGPSRRRLGAR